MKTVFSNSQLTHVFVSQDQDHGKNSNDTMYFSGPRIYSYGNHYLLGRIFTDKGIVLVNDYNYSNTTAKHRSNLFSAARHLKTYSVPYPNNESEEEKQGNIDFLLDRIINEFSRALNCRSGIKYHIEYLQDKVEELNDFIDSFNLNNKNKVILPDSFNDFLGELILFKRIKEEEKEKLNKEKREKAAEKARIEAEKTKEEDLKNLQYWKENRPIGQSAHRPLMFSGLHRLKVALRINHFKKIVETSHGAEVPIRESIKAARVLLDNDLNDSKKKYRLIGRKIGHFTVNDVTENNIIIGCHTIPIEEVKRVFLPIIERIELLEKESSEDSHYSPNYVSDFFNNRNIELSSEEVVLISDYL